MLADDAPHFIFHPPSHCWEGVHLRPRRWFGEVDAPVSRCWSPFMQKSERSHDSKKYFTCKSQIKFMRVYELGNIGLPNSA